MGADVRLEQGIQFAREGKRKEAYQILSEYVKLDPQNEQAWLWLSGVVDKPEFTRACLERVLAINPQNSQAQQGLKWLAAKNPPASAPAADSNPQQTTKPTSSIYVAVDAIAPTTPKRSFYETYDPLAPSTETQATKPSNAFGSYSTSSKPELPPREPEPSIVEPMLPEPEPSSEPVIAQHFMISESQAPAANPAPRVETVGVRPAWLGPDTSQTLVASAPSVQQPIEQSTSAVATSESSITSPQPIIDGAPCIYCGQPNDLMVNICVHCNKSLIVRPIRKPRLSRSIKIMLGVWISAFIIALPVYGILIFTLFREYQAGFVEPGELIRASLSMLFSVLFTLWLITSLFKVERAGYVVHSIYVSSMVMGWCAISVLGVLGLNSLRASNMLDGMPFMMLVAAYATYTTAVLVQAVATFFAFRDFFPLRERYQPDIMRLSHKQHLQRGDLFKKQGMTYMAIKEWEAALALKPRFVELMYDIAMGYQAIKRPDKAKEYIARALEIAPRNKILLKTQVMFNAE